MTFIRNISIVITLIYLATSCQQSDQVTEGLKIVHFPNSEKVMQSIEYKNGMKNGYMKEFYRDGSLKANIFFENDTLNDTTLMYHPNGKLMKLHVYKDKLKHGCWKEFNKEGLLYSELFFKNGLLDSTASRYTYKTRRLTTRINYKNGLKHGAEEHFYPSGKPKSIAYFKDGRECVGTKEWYENGKEINNDFEIYVVENDKVQIENTLTYYITIQNPKEDDKVFQLLGGGNDKEIGITYPINKVGNHYEFQYTIAKGGFVMDKVTIAVYRTTAFKNTIIKTKTFNVSSNNF